MTPLAQKFIRQAMEEAPDMAGQVSRLTGMRCFECSEIASLASELGDRLYRDQREKGLFDPALAFLPAPTTWIEMVVDPGKRVGFLLDTENVHLGSSAKLWAIGPDENGELVGNPLPDLALHNDAPPMHGDTYGVEDKIRYGIYAMLAIINSPKVIGRVSHAPHRGLQKRLRQVIGDQSFELLPWHEIKLSVADTEGGEGSPHMLTGTKALHFVRAFLRVKRGKLEHVRSHWRGDPSKGISQGRYHVTGGTP